MVENVPSAQNFLQKVNLARMYQLWGRMGEASDLCQQALSLIPTTTQGICPDGFLQSGKILHGVLRAIGRDKEASKLSLILGKSSVGDDDQNNKKKNNKLDGTVRRRLQTHIHAAKTEKISGKTKKLTQDTKNAEEEEDLKRKVQPKRRNRLATRLHEAREAAQRRVKRTKRVQSKRKKVEKTKSLSYEKLQEEREEQLKKFREAAAERNRKRAREKRKKIAKIEAETAARQKRLQELQMWLTKKKDEKHKQITKNEEKRRRSFASASDENEKIDEKEKEVNEKSDKIKTSSHVPQSFSIAKDVKGEMEVRKETTIVVERKTCSGSSNNNMTTSKDPTKVSESTTTKTTTSETTKVIKRAETADRAEQKRTRPRISDVNLLRALGQKRPTIDTSSKLSRKTKRVSTDQGVVASSDNMFVVRKRSERVQKKKKSPKKHIRTIGETTNNTGKRVTQSAIVMPVSKDVAQLRLTVSQRMYSGTSSIKFYGMNRLLGKGNFGIVRLASHKLSGEYVAIKMYDKSKFRSDRKMMRQLREECDYMHLMNHPNVTRLFETFSTQRRLYMVMEYVPGGSLIQHMRTEYSGKAMPEREAWRLFLPLFKGLEHIHQHNVIHRDIKLDNILLDKSASILKFTDVR
jgi:hypothetical protein